MRDRVFSSSLGGQGLGPVHSSSFGAPVWSPKECVVPIKGFTLGLRAPVSRWFILMSEFSSVSTCLMVLRDSRSQDKTVLIPSGRLCRLQDFFNKQKFNNIYTSYIHRRYLSNSLRLLYDPRGSVVAQIYFSASHAGNFGVKTLVNPLGLLCLFGEVRRWVYLVFMVTSSFKMICDAF